MYIFNYNLSRTIKTILSLKLLFIIIRLDWSFFRKKTNLFLEISHISLVLYLPSFLKQIFLCIIILKLYVLYFDQRAVK